MRHRKKKVTLDRKKAQRLALVKSLVLALFKNKRIKTTEAKAKYLRQVAEKLITTAKKETLASDRVLYSFFNSQKSGELLKKIALTYKERSSGYTRLTRIGIRKGDGARIMLIELI